MSLEPCEMLEWDSKFFGFPIARVRGDTFTQELVQQVDAWCHQAGVRCLYFLSRADDPHTTRLAEENSFRLVDIRMTFGYKVSRSTFSGQNSKVLVRHARTEDIQLLQRIARQSYYDTRFYFDTNFPRHLSDLLYKTWLKLSCEGYAQAVLIAELEGVPVGYISCHLDQESRLGKIGLVGVSSQARGQGIGQALVFSALEWFLAEGVSEVQVVTQARNYDAQRLYQRCGFLTQTIQLWYHKWYGEQ